MAKRKAGTKKEVAFYDAVAPGEEAVYDEPFFRDLVHDVVQTIKRNLKMDWTGPNLIAIRCAPKFVLQ